MVSVTIHHEAVLYSVFSGVFMEGTLQSLLAGVLVSFFYFLIWIKDYVFVDGVLMLEVQTELANCV